MSNSKKKRNIGRFAGIPLVVMESEDYISLNFSSRALLLELARQYDSHNNGKLCATFSQLKPRGWKSEDTLRRCLKELIGANLLIITKRGMYGKGKREPNFYALTWQPIDDIPGFEMDVKPTITPIRKFSLERRGIRINKAA